MRSKQAAEMASSVNAGEEDNWNTMNTTTDGNTPSESDVAMSKLNEKAETLLSSSKPKTFALDDDDSDNEEEKLDFIDRPLNQRAPTMLEKLIMRLYGPSLSVEEFLRILTLASTLFFLIGGYWLLRSLKDPVLTAICGITAIPKAKMLSVFVVLGVVTIYNRLLDTDIPKHQLFFIFGTFYFVLFASIAMLLNHPTIGLANQQPDMSRLLGWVSYCSIESFGSVMVSLFWSFANSTISLETAKAGYGLLVAMAQIGSILGPTIVNRYAQTWGIAKCYLVGALCMLLLQGTMYIYIKVYGASTTGPKSDSSNDKKPKTGVMEGLILFWKHHYIKGIFAISCLFMVEVTIVDYTMKVLAREEFSQLHPCINPTETCFGTNGLSIEATNAFTTFMGLFGQATNTLSFFLSLFGTSAIIRKLGLRSTLLLFPSLCLIIIIWIRLNPTLWTVFGAMMLLKASSYALNNPTKEILYQPTSNAVKYKAKSWIDIFGARGSKATGSIVTNAFSDSAVELINNGSLVGMAVASFLIWNATFMGKKFEEYMESGYIVGETDEIVTDRGEKSLEMAMAQNEIEDTSCAIDDEQNGDFEELDDANEKKMEKPAISMV